MCLLWYDISISPCVVFTLVRRRGIWLGEFILRFAEQILLLSFYLSENRIVQIRMTFTTQNPKSINSKQSLCWQRGIVWQWISLIPFHLLNHLIRETLSLFVEFCFVKNKHLVPPPIKIKSSDSSNHVRLKTHVGMITIIYM